MGYQDFQAKYLELANSSPYIAGVKKPGRRIQRMQYYIYDALFSNLAAAATTTNTVNLETQADSDFVLTYISGGVRATGSNAMVYNANVTMQITDQSSGKPFFNTFTLLPLVAGAGGFPFLLSVPRVINPNTTLSIGLRNRTGVVLTSAEIALHGTRIYYES